MPHAHVKIDPSHIDVEIYLPERTTCRSQTVFYRMPHIGLDYIKTHNQIIVSYATHWTR